MKIQTQGIIPRLLKDFFERIENIDPKYVWNVQVSFLEIYQEKLKDLLNTEEKKPTRSLSKEEKKKLEKNKLKIMQLGSTIYVSNATKVNVKTYMAAQDILIRG